MSAEQEWLTPEEFGVSPAQQPQVDTTDRNAFHAKRAGIPRELLASVIQQESGGNPLAVNTSSGAAGLGGLMPATARSLGVDDVFDEDQNRRATADYLAQGYKKYGGDLRKAAMYHFAGPNEKIWGPKTQAYGNQVLARINKMTGGAQPAQASATKSDEWMSPEEFGVTEKPQQQEQDFTWSPTENLKQTAKEAIGNTATIGDFFLQMPAFITGFLTNAATAGISGLREDKTREQAWAEGRKAMDTWMRGGPLNGWQSAPLGKLVDMLGDKKTYDESATNKVLEKVGAVFEDAAKWVDDKSDGSIPKDAVLTLVDGLMAGGGSTGIKLAGKLRAKVEADMPAVVRTGRRAPDAVPDVIRRREAAPTDIPPPEGVVEHVNPTQGAFQIGTQDGGDVKPHIRPKSTPEQIGQVFDEETGQPKSTEALQQFVREHPQEIATGAAAVAAGGWMYMSPEDAEKIGVGGLMMAGAVKGKGGMWHPDAVKKLATPLGEKLVQGIAARIPEPEAMGNQAVMLDNWANKSVKSYLNKHAGTEGDPLRTVEFPMLGDGVTFGDAMDKAVGTVPEQALPSGARPGESVWTVDPSRTTSAVQQVLAHVGDYLREFVPPEKLGQMDFVRAVQETAKQDAIQAAKMAKARVNQEGTVDHKVYPDGMKWVEVGVPAESGLPKGYDIVPTTEDSFVVKMPKEHWTELQGDLGELPPQTEFATRAEAEAAARRFAADMALRNEGDVMGHCVGGYCEMVHNGESKIYSLRDEKGMSHVTIEVEPKGAVSPDGNGWASQSDNIIQIKGKQNRAPVAKYLPYVQDFVKSGKWGDVGDLGNTGLHDVARLSPAEKYVASKLYPEEKFLTEAQRADLESPVKQAMSEGAKDLEGRVNEIIAQRQKERGSVDPKLLAGIAGAAIGVYADPDHKLIAGTLGALTGLAVASRFGRSLPAVRALEKGYKASIEQIQRKINPDALGKHAEESSAILASHYVKQLQKEIYQGKMGKDRKEFFERLPVDQQVAFIKGLETPGVRYKDPVMQKLREGYKDWSNKIYEQDKANGIEYKPEDNYISHIFEDPQKVTEYLQQKYGKKFGDPGFTKDRAFKTIGEAEKVGFKLKYTNPEQIMQARQIASDIAQLKVDALKDLADNGLARRVTKGDSAGVGEATWRSPNGDLYFLSDHANQVMHNAFNTKSLWDDAGLLGMTYRGAMWTKNAILPFKLLSGFHALHIALGMNLGTTAVNTIKGLAGKNIGFGRAALDMGKSALLLDSMRQSIFVSRKMQPHSMRAFRGDIPADKITELDKQQMQNAYDGGFSPEMSEEYRNQSIKDFSAAIARNSVKAAWHAPFALMEAAWTRPMFQNWIPAVKWEAFQKSAAAHLAANPQLAGDSLARRAELRKISKMIDDRFGEVQYKTLFMDRVVKDIGVASFLSYGWQLGFVRSYLGAFPEMARAFVKDEGVGKQSLRDKIKQGKLDKTLFLQNYITGTMLYGGLMTYAMTGQLPKSILDYIYPRSGDKNKDGTDARISTPFYTREFVQIPSHVAKEGLVGGLATTVKGKLNPVLGLMKGIVLNKDYFDKALYNPTDTTVQKIQKKGKWLLGEMEPMAMNRPKNAPDTKKSQVLSAAGFNPAPKYVTHPNSEQEWITVPKRSKKQ